VNKKRGYWNDVGFSNVLQRDLYIPLIKVTLESNWLLFIVQSKIWIYIIATKSCELNCSPKGKKLICTWDLVQGFVFSKVCHVKHFSQNLVLTRKKIGPCICDIFYFIGLHPKMGNLWWFSWFFSPIWVSWLIFTLKYLLLSMVSFHSCKNTLIRVSHSFRRCFPKGCELILGQASYTF